MADKEKCCGTCKWHHPDDSWPADWLCTNPVSENLADWTEYEDSCEEWEERETKKK